MPRTPHPMPPNALLLGLVAATMLTGCGTTGGTVARQVSPVQQHEIGARTRAKKARAGSAASTAKPAVSTGDPAMDRALTAYRVTLRNAAARDREMESLIRRYLRLTRDVFQHFRINRPKPGDPASYDPLPAWRFQGQQSFEYRLLAARAGVVRRHLGEMANALHLNADAVPRGRGREARVALYRRIFDCIRTDALARAEHGRRYLARVAQGPGLPPEMRVGMYQGELTMLRRSVQCTTLTSMRRPEMAAMWQRRSKRR